MQFKVFSFTSILQKVLLTILIACIILGIYKENILLTLAPLVALAALLLIKNPKHLYFLLFISIPFSITLQISSSTIEFPDELLMIFASALIPVIIYVDSNKSKLLFHPLIYILFGSFIWLFFQLLLTSNLLVTSKYILAKAWTVIPFSIGLVYVIKSKKELNQLLLYFIISCSLIYSFLAIKHILIGVSFETANVITFPFFLNHVSYSTFAVIILPFTIYLYQNTNNYWTRKFLLYSVFLFLFAIITSYTRTSWIALSIMPLIYLVVIFKKTLIAFSLSVICIVFAAFYLLHNNYYLDYAPNKLDVIYHDGDFDKHIESTVELTDMSGMERVYRWIATKNALNRVWLSGTGPSTFYDEYKKYTESLFETYVSDNPEKSTTHNYFLLLFFEQGIIGLLLFITLIGTFLYYCDYYYSKVTEYRALLIATATAFICILIHQFLNDQIETDEVGSIFYLCIGIFIYIHFNEIKKT